VHVSLEVLLGVYLSIYISNYISIKLSMYHIFIYLNLSMYLCINNSIYLSHTNYLYQSHLNSNKSNIANNTQVSRLIYYDHKSYRVVIRDFYGVIEVENYVNIINQKLQNNNNFTINKFTTKNFTSKLTYTSLVPPIIQSSKSTLSSRCLSIYVSIYISI
jgi:hypothetical protein